MIFALLTAFVLCVARADAPGTEFVLVLDNSCSMVEPHTRTGGDAIHPAADPERRAVLGALLVAGLAGDKDKVTVLGFPRTEGGELFDSSDPTAIRDIPISTGTFFREPLQRASRILRKSNKQDRMLLFLSDGDPNDLEEPEEGRELLGLERASVPFDTLILGLFPGDAPRGERFLKQLALAPDDYVRVRDGSDLVTEFTEAYARLLGSKAITGRLGANPTEFEVPRYVTEVLAVTTNVQRDGPFEAFLREGSTTHAPAAQGDNGCSGGTRRNPDLCAAPRLHYTTWHVDHDPETTATFSIGRTGNKDVAFGVILRYDLNARAEVPRQAETNKPVRVRGRLMWRRKPFVDEEFFARDGFKAEATVAGVTIPLEHVGEGWFEGDWTPVRVGRNDVVVRFSNSWMEKRDRVRVRVAPDKPLALSSDVPAIDFGHWAGERGATERCVQLLVEANRALGSDTLAYEFEGLPEDLTVLVTEQEQGIRVCARARGCCGDIDAAGSALRVDASADGEQASVRIPIRAQVDRVGFLACWWPWLLGLLLLLLLLFFLYGWIRPHDFDEDLTVKVAGSERQLSRSANLVLREQPGGRRGFYRNARIALTGAGDFVRNPRNAAVWIEAIGDGETAIHPRSTVEIQDRRTKQWVALSEEDAADGIKAHTTYRVGDILFRFQ